MKRARIWLLAIPLLSICFAGFDPSGAAGGQPRHANDPVFLYLIDGVSFEDLMAVRDFRELAVRGGAGLMTTAVSASPAGEARRLAVLNGNQSGKTYSGSPLLYGAVEGIKPVCITDSLDVVGEGESACVKRPEQLAEWLVIFDLRGRTAVADGSTTSQAGRFSLSAIALDAKRRLDSSAERALVIVVAPDPSRAMDTEGDEVTPMVVAWRIPGDQPRALTSDTTRQVGLLANVDVAPTVLRFLRQPIPEEMTGSSVQMTDAGLPFSLHRLHLEQRRIRLPIQLAQIAFVCFLAVVGVWGLLALRAGRALSPRVTGVLQLLALCGLALPVTVLAGGLLPRLTYGAVVPYLVVTTVALVAMSLTARARGPMGPVVFLGAVSLGFVLLDGVLGGRAFRVPLMGGTMFDGVRFYGLPNGFIAVPLAGALFVAVTLRPYAGFVLLIAVALFAGFPSLGANLGAATTILAAAGLWWVLTTRERFGLREASFVAGVVALGLGIVLLVNRYVPEASTHIGRFAERSGGGLGALFSVVWNRLEIGIRMLNDVPIAYIPVLGLPVVAWLARTARPPFDRVLRTAGGRWRDAVTVIAVASFISFFANDTGVAAAAPGFLYALAPLAYAAFVANGRSVPAPSMAELANE